MSKFLKSFTEELAKAAGSKLNPGMSIDPGNFNSRMSEISAHLNASKPAFNMPSSTVSNAVKQTSPSQPAFETFEQKLTRMKGKYGAMPGPKSGAIPSAMRTAEKGGSEVGKIIQEFGKIIK